VSGRDVLPHHLLNLKSPQSIDQPWPDHKTNEKSGENRINRPKRDIPEDVEKGKKFMKGIEEMI
jgi:hypothetical protein